MTFVDIKAHYPPVEIPDEELTISYDIEGNGSKKVRVGQVEMSAVMVQRGIVPDPRINLPKIKNMDVYDDDVFICAHGKAGTHWVWEITTMLIRGNAEYDPRNKESVMMEFHYPEEFKNLARPRVLNTHLPYDCLPTKLLERRCKIVFIQRNPKDIFVSGYNHMKNLMPPGMPTPSWNVFVESFMRDEYALKRFADYKKGFEEALADRSDHICPLFYEDLKKNQVAQIQKLAEFLQTPCSKEFAEKVAAKCSFKNLKEADKKKKNEYECDWNYLYRKGEVGDWKNWFTVAQSEKMDACLDRHIRNSPFQYQYT